MNCPGYNCSHGFDRLLSSFQWSSACWSNDERRGRLDMASGDNSDVFRR